jgi:histidine triad (HIT) family protein
MSRLVHLARSPLSRFALGWILAHMSFAIPVQRLRETSTLIAFRHPRPSYPVHILIVPKKSVPDFAALTPADASLLMELTATVQSLVAELGLEAVGYRLIVNGGPYQDVPHLHFHLVSGAAQP